MHSSQSLVNQIILSEASVITTTGEASAVGSNRCTCSFTLLLKSQWRETPSPVWKIYMKIVYVECEVRKAAVRSEEQAH